MTTIVQAQLDTLALNIRYGLARRGHYNATRLEALLNVTAEHASAVYSGQASYTVGDLGKLAAYFGVKPSDLLSENLIVSAGGGDENRPEVTA